MERDAEQAAAALWAEWAKYERESGGQPIVGWEAAKLSPFYAEHVERCYRESRKP